MRPGRVPHVLQGVTRTPVGLFSVPHVPWIRSRQNLAGHPEQTARRVQKKRQPTGHWLAQTCQAVFANQVSILYTHQDHLRIKNSPPLPPHLKMSALCVQVHLRPMEWRVVSLRIALNRALG